MENVRHPPTQNPPHVMSSVLKHIQFSTEINVASVVQPESVDDSYVHKWKFQKTNHLNN